MQKVVKIVVCLLVALTFGAGASATLRAALEPPEITNWKRTGELRFDRPVSEDYARLINEEVGALRIKARPLGSTGTDAIPATLGDLIRTAWQGDAVYADALKRYEGPAIVPRLFSMAIVLFGMLLDPLLLTIEVIAFALSWAGWGKIARLN